MLLFCLISHRVRISSQCIDADSIYGSDRFQYDVYPMKFKEFKFMDSNKSYAGQGHFSVVRKQKLESGENVAVKEIRIFSKRALIKELQTLIALNGTKNTMQVIGLMGNESHPTVLYSYHSSTPNAYVNMSLPDFKWWLKETLTGLSEIHRKGVIHRDINLGNVLCDLKKRKVTIIDFGLSEFYRPTSTNRNTKTGCVRFKAPELIIERKDFDCGIDIWSLGICCLDMILGLKNNWEAKGTEQIRHLIETYFGRQWFNYAKKHGVKTRMGTSDIFELALPGSYSLINEATIDIVMKMLTVDPKYRPSAAELLNHPLFDNVK